MPYPDSPLAPSMLDDLNDIDLTTKLNDCVKDKRYVFRPDVWPVYIFITKPFVETPPFFKKETAYSTTIS
jgi:hypothetical protein